MPIRLDDEQYLLWIKDPSVSPFINIKNRPKVKMVIGIVNTIIIGFTIALRKAKVAAKIIAVIGPSNLTPGKIFAVTKIARVDITILKIKFISGKTSQFY